MRGWARFAALLAALLLSACASTIDGPAAVGGESLAGRLAIRIDAFEGAAARSENAGFELLGGARAGVYG